MKLEIRKISGDGDLVLILPEELIQQLGWAQGDEVAASVSGRLGRLLRLLRVELRYPCDWQSDRRRALGAGACHRRLLLAADHARFHLAPRMGCDSRDLARRGDRVAPRACRCPRSATAIVPPTSTIGRLIWEAVSFRPLPGALWIDLDWVLPSLHDSE